jgi:hypothetical protein
LTNFLLRNSSIISGTTPGLSMVEVTLYSLQLTILHGSTYAVAGYRALLGRHMISWV